MTTDNSSKFYDIFMTEFSYSWGETSLNLIKYCSICSLKFYNFMCRGIEHHRFLPWFIRFVGVLMVFKTSLMFEGLQILRSYCTHSYTILYYTLYYSKRTQIKASKEKGHMGRSGRNQAQASRFSLPVENIYTEGQRKGKKKHTKKH